MYMPNTQETLGKYINFRKGEAEIDRLDAETDLIKQRDANEAIRNAIMASEAEHAPGYYSNRRGKMTFDNQYSNIRANVASTTSAYAQDMAIEKLKQLRVSNENLVSQGRLTFSQFLGQEIKNYWDKSGLTPGSPYSARMSYRQLTAQGVPEQQVAAGLVAAGVGTQVLRTFVPAGVLGRAIRGARRSGTSASTVRRRTPYNSSESWRSMQRRLDDY
jgi:hypothetical protein